MKRLRYLLAFLPLLLTCCGGGSSPAAAPRPVAEAGTNQNVAVATVKTLNGTWSSGGDALSYYWTMTAKPDGSAATITDPTTPTPTFTPDLPGTYTFSLVVSTGQAASTPDSVTMEAMPGTDVLVLYSQNQIEGWLVNEPIESAPLAIQNGYPHLQAGWNAGTVRAQIFTVPFVDSADGFVADKYEVVEWVIQKKLTVE